MAGRFDPRFEDLPASLPIFPLPGVLLLPRGRLPLNIFEPRYLAMIRDALATDRLIGMIQPTEAEMAAPAVYGLGCAGRITQFSETDDGRYLITLTGLCRFKVVEELATIGGYRRIKPDFSAFRADLSCDAGPIDRERLIAALKIYFKRQGLSVDWSSIEHASPEKLVNSLAMICPFDACEKQALLEAECLAVRSGILTAIIELAIAEHPREDPTRH